MKKVLAVLLALVMVLSFAACGKSKPLADEGHEAWVAHGQYLLADGTQNGWNGKDTAVYEASALTAIAVDDVKSIDSALYETLKGKDVKYLYKGEYIFGTNDAGWTTDFLNTQGILYRANGSYAFKVAQCTAEVDGNNKVYAEDQWISDPKTAYAESLTPETMFMPVWQEEPDQYGFSWASNPVVTGGAGLYTLVIAQYNNASAPGQPGYGIGLVLKEAKEGIAYEEVRAYVAADHTYSVIGSFAGSDWTNDVAMTKTADNTYEGEVTLKAGDEFKVRADNDWTYSWGSSDGNNMTASADGTYLVKIVFENGDDSSVILTATPK